MPAQIAGWELVSIPNWKTVDGRVRAVKAGDDWSLYTNTGTDQQMLEQAGISNGEPVDGWSLRQIIDFCAALIGSSRRIHRAPRYDIIGSAFSVCRIVDPFACQTVVGRWHFDDLRTVYGRYDRNDPPTDSVTRYNFTAWEQRLLFEPTYQTRRDAMVAFATAVNQVNFDGISIEAFQQLVNQTTDKFKSHK